MSEQKIIERLTEELELALAENAKLKRLEGVVITDQHGETLDWEIVEGVVEVSVDYGE